MVTLASNTLESPMVESPTFLVVRSQRGTVLSVNGFGSFEACGSQGHNAASIRVVELLHLQLSCTLKAMTKENRTYNQ